jgi:phasin family protein
MAKTKPQSAFPFTNGEFAKLFDFNEFTAQLKVPGVDSDVLLETQRKNFEAVTKANQVAIEGVQAVAQRQAEILRQAIEEATKAVGELSKPGKPTDVWAKQAEVVKEAYEHALANVRELTEMSTKSNTEATDLLTHRFADSLDEIKGVFKETAAAK